MACSLCCFVYNQIFSYSTDVEYRSCRPHIRISFHSFRSSNRYKNGITNQNSYQDTHSITTQDILYVIRWMNTWCTRECYRNVLYAQQQQSNDWRLSVMSARFSWRLYQYRKVTSMVRTDVIHKQNHSLNDLYVGSFKYMYFPL